MVSSIAIRSLATPAASNIAVSSARAAPTSDPASELDERIRTEAAGVNSIETFWLEFWLEKPLEIWLEIPYTKKMFKNC